MSRPCPFGPKKPYTWWARPFLWLYVWRDRNVAEAHDTIREWTDAKRPL
jgi:hypothetical protein